MKTNTIHALLYTKIEDLPFSDTTISSLKLYGIDNLNKLIQLTKDDIITIRFIDHKAASDIECFLNESGLSFILGIKKTQNQNVICDSNNVITNLINSSANVSITLHLDDLLKFANHLIHTTKEALEGTILAKNKETYVTSDEASTQLHVDRSTLWRWAKNSYLIPVEVGGKRLYKQSDIDIILDK